MIVGIPREIKPQENRVAMVPAGVEQLCGQGHQVLVQKGAGQGSGFEDDEYASAGAEIVPRAEDVFSRAGLIVKVKEPLKPELALLGPQHILFTFLHLAPDPELTLALMKSGCTAIAYETVTGPGGSVPLLAPMSQVAGRLSVQAGAHHLEKHAGGRGVLLGGIPGVRPARVVIIGGGSVGAQAASVALGMGGDTVLLDINPQVMEGLERAFQGRLRTVYSTPQALAAELAGADLVIGAVYVTGARAPRLVTRAHLKSMKPGAVLVDVAIDQGGCAETSRPTTHGDPVFVEEGVVHYCVANMPGAVPRTSTLGLTNVTLPRVLALAGKGLKALEDDPGLADGLNIEGGKVRHRAVAESTGLPFEPWPGVKA